MKTIISVCKRHFPRFILYILIPILIISEAFVGLSGISFACTGGGAMGLATPDGRPITWQNLDWETHQVTLNKYEGASGEFDALGISCGYSFPWNGLNSNGLAHVLNLLGSMNNSGSSSLVTVLNQIGRKSATISDVKDYLDNSGPRDIGQNFIIMEKEGKIRDFEVGPSDYWEYDPEYFLRQSQPGGYYESPRLFVVRTNLPFKNEDHQELDTVIEGWSPTGSSRRRYLQARELFIQGIDSSGITLEEVMGVSRHGNPGYDEEIYISRPTKGSSIYSIWGSIFLGVKVGEDPKFATMLVAMGIPDYSIYIPVWTDLSQSELSTRTTAWNDTNIGWWVFKLFQDRFDGAADYDDYVRSVFDDVENNIISAVKLARINWLDDKNTSRFHQEAEVIHRLSAWAAYRAITSAYDTSAGNKRGCNLPPKITTLNPSKNGLNVTFQSDVSDSDGISYYYWDFGDGNDKESTEDISIISHTYESPGTYIVAFYAKDAVATPSANVRFEYVTVTTGDGSIEAPANLRLID